MTENDSSQAVTTKFILAVDKRDKAVSSVAVAGTFTSWTPIPLAFVNGCWEARMGVTPGPHQYKFILDGEWVHDEDKHSVDNDKGSRNNTLVVFRRANVTEVASSCLKNIKSGIAYREKRGILKYRERRDILKPVSKALEKCDQVEERANKEEVDDLEFVRIEAERTHDQDAILKDIREGLFKNAIKREICTPPKKPVDHPVFDVVDDTEESLSVELKQIEDFVPKYLQTDNMFVNWGEEKSSEVDVMVGAEVEKWKVGDDCVAKWRGRYWYNGQIVEIIHDQVLVKYLDYGDEDYANLNELKPAGSLDEDGTLIAKDGTMKAGAAAADDNHEASTDDSNAATISKLGKSNLSTEKKPKLAPNRCAE